jgi:DNA-binding CsgD family transcriptional regulator
VTTLQDELLTSPVLKRRDILTRRERDCLILTGRGKSEKEVAQKLDISPNTVRVHIENIKRKLGAENKSHALILSLLSGETEIGDFEDPGFPLPL